jgi:hypothetical protein
VAAVSPSFKSPHNLEAFSRRYNRFCSRRAEGTLYVAMTQRCPDPLRAVSAAPKTNSPLNCASDLECKIAGAGWSALLVGMGPPAANAPTSRERKAVTDRSRRHASQHGRAQSLCLCNAGTLGNRRPRSGARRHAHEMTVINRARRGRGPRVRIRLPPAASPVRT